MVPSGSFRATRSCPLCPLLAGRGGDGTLALFSSCVPGRSCACVCHPLAGPAQLYMAETGSCWALSSSLWAFAAGIQLFKCILSPYVFPKNEGPLPFAWEVPVAWTGSAEKCSGRVLCKLPLASHSSETSLERRHSLPLPEQKRPSASRDSAKATEPQGTTSYPCPPLNGQCWDRAALSQLL